MTTLKDELLRLVGELRQAEVDISVAETLDATRALAAAGFAQPSRMREALAAALVKDEADRAAFDEVFRRFFGRGAAAGEAPRAGAHRRTIGVGGGRGSEGASGRAQRRRPEAPSYAAEPRHQPQASHHERERRGVRREAPDAPPPAAEADNAGRGGVPQDAAPPRALHQPADARADIDEPGVDASRQSVLRAAHQAPFAEYTDLEYEAARDALAPLARRFRMRLGRRLHPAQRGRIDFRRTIRASLQRGGALVDLRFRARRPRHTDLLILADVSGSVRFSAALMLELVAGVHKYFRRVRSFLFIDRLAEADFVDGRLATEPGLDSYARSDFGRVLSELWARRAALVSRATLTVILGDGRNNRRPARADILRDLRRQCRAIVWLTPEKQERWGTGDSAIYQYGREVDALYCCANFGELARALERSIGAAA